MFEGFFMDHDHEENSHFRFDPDSQVCHRTDFTLDVDTIAITVNTFIATGMSHVVNDTAPNYTVTPLNVSQTFKCNGCTQQIDAAFNLSVDELDIEAYPLQLPPHDLWYLDGPQLSASTDTFQHSFSQNGPHTLVLKAYGQCGADIDTVHFDVCASVTSSFDKIPTAFGYILWNTSIGDSNVHWLLNGTSFSIGDTIIHNPTTVDEMCLIAYSDCDSDTLCEQLVPLGVEQTTNKRGFSIFPNPASDQLSVQLHGLQSGRLKCYAMDGRLIFEKRIDKPSVSLDLADVSAGVYLLTFTTADGSFVKKLVIE